MEKKRINWTELETHFLLTIMRDQNIINMLDGKRYRNTDIFQIVEEELKKRGFLKSALQIRTKWKTLKLQYYKAKRSNNTSGNNRVECPFWEELDELLGRRPACNVQGVDTSNTLDNETSEVETMELDVISVQEYSDQADQDLRSENAGANKVTEEGATTAGPSIAAPLPNKSKGLLEKKASYKEALQTFSADLKESQKEVAKYFLEKQAEIIKKELEEQREWEKKILEEDRLATEQMMTKMMMAFFNNMRNYTFPSTVQQFPFCNPSQTSLHAGSTLLPYSMPPSPLSPTEINSPQLSPLSQPLSPSGSTPKFYKNGPSDKGNTDT